VLVLMGCGSSSAEATAADPTTPSATAPAQTSPPPATTAPQPGTTDAGANDSGAKPATNGTYRDSLSVCWTDSKCKRAMIVAHGGDWKAGSAPYGSMAAVTAAYTNGAEAVKIDVRVTKDNVPVVSHSSPFEIWESLDCYNKKIEDMTAADVTGCHFAGSSETYQRLDTMLTYARGKLVVQLCVKEPTDYARTIAEVVTEKAEDFAFLEVSVQDLQTVLPPIANSGKIWWLVNVESNATDIDTLLDVVKNPHAFMVEIDQVSWAADAIKTKLHPAGLRTFTYLKSESASQSDLQALFDEGFDVVSSNVTGENLKARVATNTARGISPP